MTSPTARPPLLDVKGLEVAFFLRQGVARAINGLNLTLHRGEVLGLVGESGCGKSVTSLAIMQLIEEPGKILQGQVLLEGEDLLQLSKRQMRQVRGNRIAMIFQDPMTGLNPVLSIGTQMMEPLRLHQKLSSSAAEEQAVHWLQEVGLPNPGAQLRRFPHELSGGMRQRVMIAMALACEPDLLIADEPTTALDVTIQAQILELMQDLQQKYGTAILMITHDLGVIAEMADRVAVMYAGDVVEEAEVEELFDHPQHPYTQGLLQAIPSAQHHWEEEQRLYNIPGTVPTLLELPFGCRFQDRCPRRQPTCQAALPPLEGSAEHSVRCLFPGDQAPQKASPS